MDRRCPIPASRLTCARALGRKQTYIGQSVPLNAMRPQHFVPLRRNYSYAIRLPRPTPPLSPVNDRLTDRLGWCRYLGQAQAIWPCRDFLLSDLATCWIADGNLRAVPSVPFPRAHDLAQPRFTLLMP